MGELKWELGRAPCCGLWLVSVPTGHLAKASPERKGFLHGWKSSWDGRTGGKSTMKQTCLVWAGFAALKRGLKLVKGTQR